MIDTSPPNSPSIEPRLRFRRPELIGIAILACLPLAAVLGVFGPSSAESSIRTGPVAVQVEYPTKLRYEMSHRIDVRIRNQAGRPISHATVTVDSAYMAAFADVTSTPAPDRPYVFEIGELGPGEERLITIELRADEYGSHDGSVTVFATGANVTIPVRTITFP